MNKKEKERVLDNFYTKKIKKGKNNRADFLDTISIRIMIFIIMLLIFNKIIANFIISLIFSLIFIIGFNKFINKINEKNRLVKIEEIKVKYKEKLQEEKVISEDEDIEDYIISRYLEKKQELKSDMNILSKDKIFKLYALFIVFFVGSYFVSYSMYYKIMSVIVFIMATFIGSYNLTEYIKKERDQDLLNKDIDV